MANQSYPARQTYWTPAPGLRHPASSLRHVIGARWVWTSILALAFFVATYLALVRTYLGQYLENSALLGAKQSASAAQVTDALDNLDVISYTSLAVALVVLVVIGLVRRSWRIAAAGAFTLGFSTVLAEFLKRLALNRPDLAPIYEHNAHNSFPSGHTTIAMSILVALLLVFSYRWRGLMMLVATGWAVTIGEATITARWHRLSDTMGADMIAICVGALVALWLLRHDMFISREQKTYPLRVVFVVLLSALTALALVSGLLVAIMTLQDFGVFHDLAAAKAAGVAPNLTAHLDPQFNDNLFIAAQSLAFAFSALAALWFWGTLHRIGTRSNRAVY